MKLYNVDIRTTENHLIKDNCTIGIAFTTIDNWCKHHKAWYNIENIWMDTDGVGTRAKINIKCFFKDNNKLANVFKIKY